MKRINTSEVKDLQSKLTVDNFNELTQGLPVLLRAMLAAQLGAKRVAEVEAERTTNKLVALKEHLENDIRRNS